PFPCGFQSSACLVMLTVAFHKVNLEYLDHESMHLFTNVPRLNRMCKTPVQVHGLNIPEGTIVAIPLNIVHMHPRFWSSPEKFRPERFSKDSGEEVNPYAFMPVGLGPRNCVGMRYAILIVKLVLVRLLQSYSLETCKDTMVRVYSHVLSDCYLKLSL
uniref:Cytochrome P450, family 3, subfamily A, polypeptide 65 n=1 Tax=Labrus bergylta TaxID=56723 RepID=A0A3Q3G237_9LABR